MSELDVAFEARIERQGVLRCVDVPANVSKRISGRAQVPVIVEVGGAQARTALAPCEGGGFRLFLHSKLRRAAGVDTGEVVRLRVRTDPAAWDTELPGDLADALRETPGASAMYEGLTPGLRRELIRYVEDAKAAPTRERRIRDAIERLIARALDRTRNRKQAASTSGRREGAHESSREQAVRESPELVELLELYEGPVADLARRSRAMIREVLPDLREEVDRNAKLIGYAVGHRHSDTVCTLHLSRKGVKIGVYEGASLPDPRGLLEGAGKQHRHVPLAAPKDLRKAGLRPLLKASRKAARQRAKKT